jgi:hypothetical protein
MTLGREDGSISSQRQPGRATHSQTSPFALPGLSLTLLLARSEPGPSQPGLRQSAGRPESSCDHVSRAREIRVKSSVTIPSPHIPVVRSVLLGPSARESCPMPLKPRRSQRMRTTPRPITPGRSNWSGRIATRRNHNVGGVRRKSSARGAPVQRNSQTEERVREPGASEDRPGISEENENAREWLERHPYNMPVYRGALRFDRYSARVISSVSPV